MRPPPGPLPAKARHWWPGGGPSLGRAAKYKVEGAGAATRSVVSAVVTAVMVTTTVMAPISGSTAPSAISDVASAVVVANTAIQLIVGAETLIAVRFAASAVMASSTSAGDETASPAAT